MTSDAKNEQSISHCLNHYQAVFERHLQTENDVDAMDEALQHFLDQRPANKRISAIHRAAGLVASHFWWSTQTVNSSRFAALALSRVLHHENLIPKRLLDHLALNSPDILRWAIRYSKLFTRQESPEWLHLEQSLQDNEWQIFFSVCHRLLEQLQPFETLVQQAEHQLSKLSLLELLLYLSIFAYGHLTEDPTPKKTVKHWQAYNRIITRKLLNSHDSDFNLTDARIVQSIKTHLAPLLFTSSGISQAHKDSLEACDKLIYAMQELIDYEGSIDWFCFDSDCRYQLKAGEPVIYNETGEGLLDWQLTDKKHLALWCYWMNRGVKAFHVRDMAGKQIGKAENDELNKFAYLKTLRSFLQLTEIYGLDNELILVDGTKVDLFDALKAMELTTVFFEDAFINEFRRHFANCRRVPEALSRMALAGIARGQNRFPITWATKEEKAENILGWTTSPQFPNGNKITADAILAFWISDLKELAAGLKQQPNLPTPTLTERPYLKIGRYLFQLPWVIGSQNNLAAAVNSLRRLGSRRTGLNGETHRIELRLAEQMRQCGFAVVTGYQPSRSEHEDPGEIDLICYRDGLFFLLEIKSGYIRSTRHEAWLHHTNTLRKAAWQLKRKSIALRDALIKDEKLRTELALTKTYSGETVHAWIVDTSLELDQKRVNGFLVVSLESLCVILRDERSLLQLIDPEVQPKRDSLFPQGFTASRFVEVIENGEIWNKLES